MVLPLETTWIVEVLPYEMKNLKDTKALARCVFVLYFLFVHISSNLYSHKQTVSKGANFLSAEVSVATTSFDVVPPGSAVEMAASLRGNSSR